MTFTFSGVTILGTILSGIISFFIALIAYPHCVGYAMRLPEPLNTDQTRINRFGNPIAIMHIRQYIFSIFHKTADIYFNNTSCHNHNCPNRILHKINKEVYPRQIPG